MDVSFGGFSNKVTHSRERRVHFGNRGLHNHLFVLLANNPISLCYDIFTFKFCSFGFIFDHFLMYLSTYCLIRI